MFPFCNFRKCLYLCTAILRKQNAQMAESVDALVSNTSGATHPGSTPGLGTRGKRSSLHENSVFLCVVKKIAIIAVLFPKITIFAEF